MPARAETGLEEIGQPCDGVLTRPVRCEALEKEPGRPLAPETTSHYFTLTRRPGSAPAPIVEDHADQAAAIVGYGGIWTSTVQSLPVGYYLRVSADDESVHRANWRYDRWTHDNLNRSEHPR